MVDSVVVDKNMDKRMACLQLANLQLYTELDHMWQLMEKVLDRVGLVQHRMVQA